MHHRVQLVPLHSLHHLIHTHSLEVLLLSALSLPKGCVLCITDTPLLACRVVVDARRPGSPGGCRTLPQASLSWCTKRRGPRRFPAIAIGVSVTLLHAAAFSSLITSCPRF